MQIAGRFFHAISLYVNELKKIKISHAHVHTCRRLIYSIIMLFMSVTNK
nr:MAG TPA: hypothetical protein [Caudoviricetes sp.]